MTVLFFILSFFFAGCVSNNFSSGTSSPEPSDNTEIPSDTTEKIITYEEKVSEEDLYIFEDTATENIKNQKSDSTSLPQSPEIPGGADTPDNFVSPLIYSAGTHTDKELYKFFCSHSKQNRSRAKKIAKLYIEECAAEGINSDVAFIQMCHETNFLRYGNLVKKEWNNFCGLGAIDEKQPGLQFKTMQLGVRAHIQHLHAYATPEEIKLNNECIDPRYKYVRPRAKATTVEGLSGTWAADKMYAEKLVKYLKELENF